MKSTATDLRLAVVGGRRGLAFIKTAKAIGDDITVTAVCDPDPARLERWQGELKTYPDFEQLLEDPDIDAVCIATPVSMHARQTIAALEAGKHVLSEVPAASSLDECRDLVAAVERSGLTYMMAENYCFMEPILQVQQMVEDGLFGDLVHASGSYIHDCRALFFTESGDLTWRGQLHRQRLANQYPTHSLGPVSRWLGINRSDFFDTTATWHSRSAAAGHFARQHLPDRAAYTAPEFWANADTVSTCIRTERGVLVDLRVDWASARPHQVTRFELQGTRASFCWPDGPSPKPEPLIWIEGRSPAKDDGAATEWEPLSKYRDEFQHPLWRQFGERATQAGHDGGDFFVLKEFAEAVREGRAPLVDVYDAATWSSITPLSAESIAGGNVPVKVPRFSPKIR
jgi:predicted dehydrogenase